jgi:hypothetical protein
MICYDVSHRLTISSLELSPSLIKFDHQSLIFSKKTKDIIKD